MVVVVVSAVTPAEEASDSTPVRFAGERAARGVGGGEKKRKREERGERGEEREGAVRLTVDQFACKSNAGAPRANPTGWVRPRFPAYFFYLIR